MNIDIAAAIKIDRKKITFFTLQTGKSIRGKTGATVLA